jgi:hypothetical protein
VKKDDDLNLSFAQLKGKCYCCGRAGPKAPSCQDRNKPKEEWAINKALKKKMHLLFIFLTSQFYFNCSFA